MLWQSLTTLAVVLLGPGMSGPSPPALYITIQPSPISSTSPSDSNLSPSPSTNIQTLPILLPQHLCLAIPILHRQHLESHQNPRRLIPQATAHHPLRPERQHACPSSHKGRISSHIRRQRLHRLHNGDHQQQPPQPRSHAYPGRQDAVR